MLNLRVDLSEEQIDEERQRYKSNLMPIAIWCFLIFDNWWMEWWFVKNILDIIASDLVDPYTINMIVSAVSLSCSVFMDAPRLAVLMRLIKSDDSTCSVRQRALVGFRFLCNNQFGWKQKYWDSAAGLIMDDEFWQPVLISNARCVYVLQVKG